MGDARFGRYRLERLLGKGGMGQVWLAHDTDAERRVALKLLPAELAADAGYRTRFEREAELAAALRDPHIVPIHRHGEIDGRLFIEMEFIEGTELAARLAAGGPMDAHAAVEILGQIASALDTAHRAGLVHRDVKPSNILVRPSGFAYLIDFGIARSAGQTAVTATGLAIGTWAYMAPERFSGKSDARSDVYSLACVLYECLTGRRPHGDTDPAQQMHGHLMIDPPRAVTLNPAIPAELDQVIARGMAKNPADRHPSAGAFARAAATALPPTPNHGAPRQRPRRIASSDRTPAPNPRPPIDTPGASHDHVAAPPVPAATKMLTDPGPTPTRVETSASAGRVPGPDQQVSSGDPAGSIGRVPDAVAGRPPVPTKMLTEPGPTPTRVETSASAGRVPGPDQQVSSGDPAGSIGRVPDAVSGRVPTPTKVLPEPGPAPTRVETRIAAPVVPVPSYPPPQVRVPGYQPNSYGVGRPPVQPGRRWYLRRAAVPVRPVPVRRPGGAVRWPSRGPASMVPPPRPMPRRRGGGVLTKVIGALVVIFLAPFAFAAGCFALIAAGTSGGSDASTATRPPWVAEENPEPAPEPPPNDPPWAPAPARTPVRDGKFEFAVTDVESGISRVGLQSAQGSYLIVTLAVRNISDEPKWFLPFGQKLFDTHNRGVDHDTTATAWQTVRHGYGYSFELTPGQSATTQLVFDIAPDATPSHLELHDFLLSNGVSVRLP